MNTKQPFVVVWFSPRNFANEGTYFYGKKDEGRKLFNNFDPCNSSFCFISGHKTIASAKAKSEALVARDKKLSPKHELCRIYSAPFSKYFED
jgi:hypothetical protein